MVADVAAGTAFPEIAGGDGGKVQSVIKLSEGQQFGVRSDGSTAKLQPDFEVDFEP